MSYNDNTPITFLTVGQLKEVLGIDSDQIAKQREKEAASSNAEQKRYVYGISGIRQLFGGISHVTAHKYKDTFLRDAVSQQGRIIVTDAEKAMRLFYEHTKGRGNH